MDKRVFIVHGWDAELKLEAKNYLQNYLGLQPIILDEQDSSGDVILNKFESFAAQCQAAVILLSERDDVDISGFSDPSAPRRPRPNVLFEMGYFFAKLGRSRVVILRKGNVELHSDIFGIEYIDVAHGVAAAGERIRTRLKWLLS
jgi:predicted nucleotide-binding protein